MALRTIPVDTALGDPNYPHLKFHSALTEIRYAHPDGNNANDGLTWGTAKQTIIGAYDALPSSGGDLYYAEGTVVGGEVANQGLWIVGPNDSSFGSPLAGWRQQKRLRLVGQNNTHTGNGRGLQARMDAGSTTDRNKPALWLTGTNIPLTFENVRIAHPAVGIRIGINPAQNTITNTANITFRELGVELNAIAGNGPGVELGYCFWVFFYDSVISGCRPTQAITAASIVSGTTARFTIGTHALEPGDTVTVSGVTPAGYNGYWTVSAVAATTFDANIGTSPGAGSAFGTVEPCINHRGAAISHNTVTGALAGQTACGLIYLENTNFNGAGFEYAPSGTTTWGTIGIRNCTHEGDFVGNEPPTMHVRAAYGGVAPALGAAIKLEHVAQADGLWPSGGVLVDGVTLRAGSPNLVFALDSGNTVGPGVINVNQPARDRRQSAVTAAGFQGHSEHAARGFGPAPVVLTNSAVQDTAAWTTGGAATVVTGKIAPDGSTNAARVSAAGGTQTKTVGAISINPLAVGDWLVAGIWRRFHSGTPNLGNPPEDHANIGFVHTNNLFDINSHKMFFGGGPNYLDDGGWDWSWVAGKVTSVGTSNTQILQVVQAADGNSIDYAYPVLVYIPAAAVIDDNEVINMARYMRTWPDGAPAGSISTMLGQKLIARGGLGVGNSAAATTPGSVVKKMEVFSETGASLGFVPIYSSIT